MLNDATYDQYEQAKQAVLGNITGISGLTAADEAVYKAEMGEDYAPPDAPEPAMYGENDIGFDFLMYPTLHKMMLSPARVKFAIGPAGCLPAETEVMTRNGWVKISEMPSEILVYNPDDNSVLFDSVEPVKYECPEGFHRFVKDDEIDMVVSDEHRVWYKTTDDVFYHRKTGGWHVITGRALALKFEDGEDIEVRIPTLQDTHPDTTFFTPLRGATYEHVPSTDGYKYCFHTRTGMFVARHNGKIFCTGNSAKTSGIIWMLLLQAMMQAPAQDGVRYSRALVARNTNSMLRSTTIPSFKTMVGNLMTFRTGSFPMTASARFDLSDGTKVHFDIEFLSFDDEKSQNKLLGCEPTFAFVDELSEFPESLVFAIDRRLGRYPSGRFGKATWVGLLGATNGPLKNHWLYRWYLGEKNDTFKEMSIKMGRPYFELFRQPPGLLRQADGTWTPNPMAENIENLPGGYTYYYAMLGGDEQKIKAYVEGEFADLVTGKVVFPEFNEARHVIPQFNLPSGAPLLLSFDFGRTPVCLVATETTGGRLIIIDEIMGEDMSIDTLLSEHVKPTLRQRYPHNLVSRATADPAGLVEAQSVDVSPYDVLLRHGIPVESPGSNKIQPRLEATKQKLTKLDRAGEPMLQITDNCKFLIEALKYNYIYESVRGKNDVVRDTPTKSHEGWCSDLADSLGYLCMHHNLVTRVSRAHRSSTKRSRFI